MGHIARTGQPGNRAGLLTLQIFALLVCLYAPLSIAQTDEWHFSEVERVVAVGDVHGAYGALVTTLQKAGVIDESLKWSGGKTHLVSTGDLLDRGAESRRAMDLMMRLEHEAQRAGGRVHQLMGNHEVMNLIGDLRYVADAEYAAFLDMESSDDRDFWYQRFRERRPIDSDEATVQWEFDEKAPPGFFGHRRGFSRTGKYGSWLLTKPFMIVINDVAYAHGGFPPYIAEHGLAGVNGTLKTELQGFLTASSELQETGVLNLVDGFKQIPSIVTEQAETGQLQGDALDTAERLFEFGSSVLFGSAGPTWYRGTAACNELVEGDSLQAVLDEIGASRVVIGHTVTITRRVQQRMSGRVIEIDTGMLTENYGGSGNVLVIENGKLSVTNEDGTTGLVPEQHPLRVGHEAIAIDESELERILTIGQIVSVAAVGAEWRLLRIGLDDRTVLAVFREAPDEKNFMPELAAFKLDRLLHLGMVPMTVRRNIGEQHGTLQFVPAVTLTERERVASGRGKGPACPMVKQMDAAFVFDALIHNASRSPSSMLFDPDDWLLMLVDHVGTFGTDTTLPASFATVDLAVGNQWRAALRALDDDVLSRELGGLLNKKRLSALGKRRDALIAQGD